MSDYLVAPSAAYDAVLRADKPSPDAGGPCATCAFRLDTEAARSQHTSTLARLCVEGITPFHCHEAPTLCRGWIAAVNLKGAPETEEERRWMECARAAAEVLATCIGKAVEDQEAAEGIVAARDESYITKRSLGSDFSG